MTCASSWCSRRWPPLSTRSLVGPLKKKEIDFFSTWLALAYRSKLPVLGFGKDKAPVADDGFCVHQADASPKYDLGVRPLPGKKMPQKGVFEPQVAEPDDFLLRPASSSPRGKRKKQIIWPRENKRGNPWQNTEMGWSFSLHDCLYSHKIWLLILKNELRGLVFPWYWDKFELILEN